MKALDNVLSKKIRLIDYEPITNEANQRLVFFGLFAGYAGAIDTFTALGLCLIKRGDQHIFICLDLPLVEVFK